MILHRAIAIDGPAASGKSTLARILSQKLGLIMVNSGAMYRAVTWKVLEQGIDPNDREAVVQALRDMEIECGVDGLASTVKVDGVDRIRTSIVLKEIKASTSLPL